MTPTRRWLPRWMRPALRAIRVAVFVAADNLAFALPRKSGNAALIIRLDAIGDFVLWLQNGAADIADELRRQHRCLVLLANPAWADMARELGIWDEVLPVDAQRFLNKVGYRLDVLRTIRKLGCAVVVQPRAARIFLLEDEMVRVSGAPARIGSDAVSANITPALRARGNRFYTRVVAVPLALDLHESLRGRAFAAALCPAVGQIVCPSRLGRVGSAPRPQEPYIVVALGAGWSGRRWPIQKFAALLTEIDRQTGMLCVVVGGHDDMPLVAALCKSTDARVDNRCGVLSLSDSVRLIGGSKLVVANESGPMHIGIWCAVPVVGIVGGGHFGWFAPYPVDASRPIRAAFVNVEMPCYRCNWACRFEVRTGDPVPCVKDVPTARVVQAALELIAPERGADLKGSIDAAPLVNGLGTAGSAQHCGRLTR